MKKRVAVRHLIRERDRLAKELAKAEKGMKATNEALTRINSLRDSKGEFPNLMNGGVVIKNVHANANKATGIWIAESRDAAGVQLVKFFEFIRDDKPTRLVIDLPNQPMIGEDGKEVTFNRGDLVACTFLGDLEKGKLGYHFANVAPSEERGQLQYEYALGKLGLGMKTFLPDSYLVVEGQFRKRGSN